MKNKRPILNKYYVAHPKIGNAFVAGRNDPWTRATESQAIEHAKNLLDGDGDHREGVVVVKIVAVIRRKKTPVKIERVK